MYCGVYSYNMKIINKFLKKKTLFLSIFRIQLSNWLHSNVIVEIMRMGIVWHKKYTYYLLPFHSLTQFFVDQMSILSAGFYFLWKLILVPETQM